jgi:Zn-dependent protease
MPQNIGTIFFEMVAFLFAISFHEAAHAWTANRCGDPTAKMMGRVTLNPIKHIDPFGTIILPIIGLFSSIGFIGWAKPTPVDPRNLKRPVWDDILVSIAGPASNMVLIVIFGTILKICVMYMRAHNLHTASGTAEPLLVLLFVSVEMNVVLAIFNLIPVPPLDGSHVIRHFLPDSALKAYDMIGTFGIMLLFLANMQFNFLGPLFDRGQQVVERIFLS